MERSMSSLFDHSEIIRALIIRDLVVRFGRENFGFVWTVLEPMILVSGVVIIWSLIHSPVFHGVPVIMFVLTAYLPLTLWRHLTNPLIKILRNNSDLFYHPSIGPIHILAAKVILEFLSTTIALLTSYSIIVSTGVIGAMGGSDVIAAPGLALEGWLFTAWYYGSFGLLLSAWTEIWDPADKFILPMQYLALPLSGVFFMVDWMPSYAQRLLLLNPSVHCFEMFRAGVFGEGVATHYDTSYLMFWCTIMTFAGFAAIFRVRNRIHIN